MGVHLGPTPTHSPVLLTDLIPSHHRRPAAACPPAPHSYDDEVRFDFFCKAALEFLLKTGRQPDILHCHDWSTAHVAQSYWSDYHPYGLHKPRVIFTIHNLNYGQKKIGEAAHACQKFTTVSPTYAYEVGRRNKVGIVAASVNC